MAVLQIFNSQRSSASQIRKRRTQNLRAKRRRVDIRDGLDRLCEIVPDLEIGSSSKVEILQKAADWLQQLLVGNQALAEQLETQIGRN